MIQQTIMRWVHNSQQINGYCTSVHHNSNYKLGEVNYDIIIG